MRAELRHLLDKLKLEREGFQSLIVTANGKAMAVFRWEPLRFGSLEELEAWAYAPAAGAESQISDCKSQIGETPKGEEAKRG